MNITFECSVSLSKKLRKLLGEEGELFLSADSLRNGKGKGTLVVNSDTLKTSEIEDLLHSETNIMFVITGLSDDISSTPTGTIFSTKQKVSTNKNTLIDNIAVTSPPERAEMKVRYNNVPTPEEFVETKTKGYIEYVKNAKELTAAINVAQTKTLPEHVDLNQCNDLERAAMLEELEKSQGIDVPAYIVNDKCANLSINDLDINLPLNVPYDLRNISAHRVANSSDLRELIGSQYIKFVSPEEVSEFHQKVIKQETISFTPDVFSSPEEAALAMESKIGHIPEVDMGLADDLGVTDEESMILNLTSKMEEEPTLLTGPRRTVHGSITQKERVSSRVSSGEKTADTPYPIKSITKMQR